MPQLILKIMLMVKNKQEGIALLESMASNIINIPSCVTVAQCHCTTCTEFLRESTYSRHGCVMIEKWSFLLNNYCETQWATLDKVRTLLYQSISVTVFLCPPFLPQIYIQHCFNLVWLVWHPYTSCVHCLPKWLYIYLCLSAQTWVCQGWTVGCSTSTRRGKAKLKIK